MLFRSNVSAIEPIDEQQFMLYYQVPLGASTPQASRHQFGMRLDRVTHIPGEDVHISALVDRTAVMDFRMGYDGIESFKVRGIDYAGYLIARAAAGEQEPVEDTKTETTPDGDTTATKPPEEGPITQALKDVPVGVIAGVILGIGIISGVTD